MLLKFIKMKYKEIPTETIIREIPKSKAMYLVSKII